MSFTTDNGYRFEPFIEDEMVGYRVVGPDDRTTTIYMLPCSNEATVFVYYGDEDPKPEHDEPQHFYDLEKKR